MGQESLWKRWEVWVLVILFLIVIVAVVLFFFKGEDNSLEETSLSSSLGDSLRSSCRDMIPYMSEEEKQSFTANPRDIRAYEEVDKKDTFVSKGEAECKRVLSKILGKSCRSQVRPDFLKNPMTGRNLELDVVCGNIAVEYHGAHHYHYIPRFHRNGPKDLEYQLWKDTYKIDQCDKNGIYLITVPYTVPSCDIEEFIRYYLPIDRSSPMKSIPDVVADAIEKLNKDTEVKQAKLAALEEK